MTHANLILDYADDVMHRKFDRSVLDVPAFHAGIPQGDARIRPDRPAYMVSGLNPLDDKAREQRPLCVRSGLAARLPTDLPAALGSIDALLDGVPVSPTLTPLESLAVVLAQSASSARWEPFNSYQVHRGIASARCLFTCDLRVAIREGDGYTIYRYLGDEHALLRIGALPADIEGFAGASLAFAITGDVARCVDPYGDFAPNLIGPEAGMLVAQLEYICRAVGWRTRCPILADPDTARKAWSVEAATELPLGLVLVDETGLDPIAGLAAPLAFTEPDWPHHLLERYPRLDKILAPFRDGSGYAQARATIDARLASVAPVPALDGKRRQSPPDDILDIVRRRNSGSYLIGFVPNAEGFDEADLYGLIRDWIGLTRLQGGNDLLGIDVHATISVLRMANGRPARHRIDFREGRTSVIDTSDLTEAHSTASTMPMANFRELNMVVTFSCDFAREVEALGPRGFLLAHQATGWLAHHFGLAAARQNMFSRPVRMYDDTVLASLIPIDGQPTIQLLCGRNRAPRLSFEIG